jgi:hypothetical protein
MIKGNPMTNLTINARENSGPSDTEANRDDASKQTWTKAMADASRDASSLGDRGDIAQRDEHPRMDASLRPPPTKDEAENNARDLEREGDAAMARGEFKLAARYYDAAIDQLRPYQSDPKDRALTKDLIQKRDNAEQHYKPRV